MNQKHASPSIFLNKASDYSNYEKTQRGYLQSELLFWQLEQWLKQRAIKNIIDIGCGIGSLAVRLSKLGYTVTAIDPEKSMVNYLTRTLKKEKISLQIIQSDLENVQKAIRGQKFDLVICHNVLHFLSNPQSALHSLSDILSPNGLLSLETRAPVGSVIYNSLVAHNFREAVKSLEESSTQFQKTSEGFTYEELSRMFKNSSLSPLSIYGVRIFFDYLPDDIAENETHLTDLLKLEKVASQILPYILMARYTHTILSK